jgi:hypothetical protein
MWLRKYQWGEQLTKMTWHQDCRKHWTKGKSSKKMRNHDWGAMVEGAICIICIYHKVLKLGCLKSMLMLPFGLILLYSCYLSFLNYNSSFSLIILDSSSYYLCSSINVLF